MPFRKGAISLPWRVCISRADCRRFIDFRYFRRNRYDFLIKTKAQFYLINHFSLALPFLSFFVALFTIILAGLLQGDSTHSTHVKPIQNYIKILSKNDIFG